MKRPRPLPLSQRDRSFLQDAQSTQRAFNDPCLSERDGQTGGPGPIKRIFKSSLDGRFLIGPGLWAVCQDGRLR